MLRVSTLSITALICLLQLTACAKSDDANAADDSATAAAPEPVSNTPPAPAAETTAEGSMTVGDIDRWQRGMDAELTAVHEAGVKFRNAKNSNDSLSAMMEANEVPTRAAGAKAAGVDENRYGTIRSTLASIVRYMVPIEQEMDVGKMPAEMIGAMNKDRDQTFARMSPAFPPAVIEALRPRAAALRKQELTLVGERLRAAGMVR